MPGRQTSKASTSYDGRAGASAAVASPTPEPISTIIGASRPNQSRPPEPGLVDRLVGDHPVDSWWAAHASCWRGVNRLPRRA